MDRLSMVVTAMVAAMAVVVTVILVADVTPAARVAREDLDWTQRMREAQTALAAGDAGTALARLRTAHQAALRTGQWEALVEVGDAARRAGPLVRPPSRAAATASRAYLAGLVRAREQRSVEGVLRVAEGFESLGDREMVEYCIGVAGSLAEHHGGERPSRVHAFVEHYREMQAISREDLRE
jgi:hypothetical protein